MIEDALGVVEPGLSTSVQDFGRFGSQRYGVSGAGAADPASFAIANRLVGNDPGLAALELTLTGGIYEVLADSLALALSGADMPMTVAGRPLPPYETHILRRGDEVRIGPARSGLRAYLAVAGGIAVPPVLGSRSTHWRTGLGGLDGRLLRSGDRLPRAPAPLPVRRRLPRDRRPYIGGVIPVMAGPQADAFLPEALDILTTGHYRLSARSDRMGALLDGPPLPFRDGFNIVSDGVVAGSIQVPGHGRPLVLLADRQTTGGYPKIATVTSPGLCRMAQRRPHDRIVFHLVSAEEAEARYHAWRRNLDDIAGAIDPI
jgi:biotin-dependent carboxylase-like uncharacterized protein